MAKTLFTSKGAALDIGRELGRGGEGSVFDVPASAHQVAKLYHPNKLPNPKKQAKLSFMVASADQQLLNYLAWPQETLHQSRGGPVVGFLMPKVIGKEPIHMVYSPAHRRQDHPKAAWNFLLFVARNIAASFEAVHAHGHVIGDVNQDSVMVGRDSKVVLIDSDSYQVNAHGSLHLCEVGVPHFTPPELQGKSSFDGFARTTNHDNFGLALLVFHVLFGGRHPYSGVPLKKGVGDALENDIKHFRYAYARDAQGRGIAAPPRSIPLAILPDAMETMFHQAFTERGAQGGRPTAQQWVTAMDSLRNRLKTCAAASMHVYPDHLRACPWCELEQQGVVYFLDMGTVVTPTITGFTVEKAWARIEQVLPPPAIPIPGTESSNLQARPLPAGVPGQVTVTFYRILIAAVALGVVFVAPKIWFLAVIGGLFGWGMASTAGGEERKAERKLRAAALEWAEREYNQLVEQLQQCGPDGFHAKKGGLATARNEYINLPKGEKEELDRLHASARERQLKAFLDRCFIDSANIKDVGPARKAALRSFGIETAADVERSKVRQVRGFGERLTSSMMDWRASCERRFTFNPAQAVTESDRKALRAKYASRKSAIEAQLVVGAEELQRFNRDAMVKAAALKPQIEWAAQKVAQARKDLSLL